MESSDNLGERASKQRNGKCKGPVVADEGMDWRESDHVERGALRMGIQGRAL